MSKAKFHIQWWSHIRQWVVCVSIDQTRIPERYYYAKSKSDAIAEMNRMEAKEHDDAEVHRRGQRDLEANLCGRDACGH